MNGTSYQESAETAAQSLNAFLAGTPNPQILRIAQDHIASNEAPQSFIQQSKINTQQCSALTPPAPAIPPALHRPPPVPQLTGALLRESSAIA
jgi:hypothetical protein